METMQSAMRKGLSLLITCILPLPVKSFSSSPQTFQNFHPFSLFLSQPPPPPPPSVFHPSLTLFLSTFSLYLSLSFYYFSFHIVLAKVVSMCLYLVRCVFICDHFLLTFVFCLFCHTTLILFLQTFSKYILSRMIIILQIKLNISCLSKHTYIDK